jgi:hypothetical protein
MQRIKGVPTRGDDPKPDVPETPPIPEIPETPPLPSPPETPKPGSDE